MISAKQELELGALATTVIEGAVESVDLPYMVPIRDFERVLKGLGFNKLEMDGEETNGWQVDFFYTFTHPKKGKYLLMGSLHYGNYKFTKDDDK